MGREIRHVPLDWDGWKNYDYDEWQGGSPEGEAFQAWETTGDTPITPPFVTKEELRNYIVNEMGCSLGGVFNNLSIEATDVLLEEEFVPSFILTSRGLINGAEGIALERKYLKEKK